MAFNKLTGSRALLSGGLVPQVKKLSINAAPTGSEQSTGFVLPAKAVVMDVFVDVRVAEVTGTTKLLDIGTDGSGSNDPNGFIAALSVATTGVKRGDITATATKGALLVDTATDIAPAADVTSGGETVTFTASANDWVEFRGDIYIVYLTLG